MLKSSKYLLDSLNNRIKDINSDYLKPSYLKFPFIYDEDLRKDFFHLSKSDIPKINPKNKVFVLDKKCFYNIINEAIIFNININFGKAYDKKSYEELFKLTVYKDVNAANTNYVLLDVRDHGKTWITELDYRTNKFNNLLGV